MDVLTKKHDLTEERLLLLVYEDTVEQKQHSTESVNLVQQLAIHPLGNFAFQ